MLGSWDDLEFGIILDAGFWNWFFGVWILDLILDFGGLEFGVLILDSMIAPTTKETCFL